MKQTAVEWLVYRLSLREDISLYAKEIKAAKAMEKEQLQEMYLRGIENYDPTFKRKSNDTNRIS